MKKATVSYRIGPQRWIDDERFDELLRLFAAYPAATDELTFFTQETHTPLPIHILKERALILTGRLVEARRQGYRAGINHLSTLGHFNENLSNSVPFDFGRVIGLDGTISLGVLCPNDPKVKSYTVDVYRCLAEAQPDYIWIDDDFRLGNHYPVHAGCCCENCLSMYEPVCGFNYTQQSLQAALNTGSHEQKRTIRKTWTEHCQRSLSSLLELIEQSVHGVNPEITLGMMSTELYYEGYDFAKWNAILAGPENHEVIWRPGGGFYTDDRPADMLAKSHAIGRLVSVLPEGVVDIQSEIESWPYQPLKKSRHITTVEAASYIAAGCTGAAFNVLDMCDEPIDAYASLVGKIADTKPFFDLLVEKMGRYAPLGVYTGWRIDSMISSNLSGGDWPSGDIDRYLYSHADEILAQGIPVAYTSKDAAVSVLSGDSVLSLSDDEITQMLSTAVYMDAQALTHLNNRGCSELTGFNIGSTVMNDGSEKLLNHPLNLQFEGCKRDARQSFVGFEVPVTGLIPIYSNSEPLAHVVDYTGAVITPCCMGVFENHLGGRVCVSGYYPWTFLQSPSKSSQIKSVLRWLSKDGLPVYVGSLHKVTTWCRRTDTGEMVVALVNASLDTINDLSFLLQTKSDEIRIFDMNCNETMVAASGTDGPYKLFMISGISAWEMRLITAVDGMVD